jgi:hypothetical protein
LIKKKTNILYNLLHSKHQRSNYVIKTLSKGNREGKKNVSYFI